MAQDKSILLPSKSDAPVELRVGTILKVKNWYHLEAKKKKAC